MSRTICFMDEETGQAGTCHIEGLDTNQIEELMPNGVIDCKHCEFYKKYKGKEREAGFYYTAWTGELSPEKNKMELNRTNLQNYQNGLSQLDKCKSDFADLKAEFETQNRVLLSKIANLTAQSVNNKMVFKAEAEEVYMRTGNKKLIGGLGVRVGTELIYKSEDALKWAKEHSLALSLDKRRFEQLAKTENLEFVEKKEKVTITFPKNIKFEEEKFQCPKCGKRNVHYKDGCQDCGWQESPTKEIKS